MITVLVLLYGFTAHVLCGYMHDNRQTKLGRIQLNMSASRNGVDANITLTEC